jgi:hypothetical protein
MLGALLSNPCTPDGLSASRRSVGQATNASKQRSPTAYLPPHYVSMVHGDYQE